MAEDGKDVNKPDPAQAFQSLLTKHNNDALSVASKLFDENFQLREEKRQLSGKVPADGSVVLSKADADRWEAFKALGKKPEDVKKALDDAATVADERDTLKKKDILRDVAATQGYKLSVLQDRDKASGGLEYKLKDEKDAKGETRKVAYVVVEGKESPLEEYAANNWADFIPALKLEQGQQQVKTGMGLDPPPKGVSSTFERIRENVKKTEEKRARPTTLGELFGRAPARQ